MGNVTYSTTPQQRQRFLVQENDSLTFSDYSSFNEPIDEVLADLDLTVQRGYLDWTRGSSKEVDPNRLANLQSFLRRNFKSTPNSFSSPTTFHRFSGS